MEPIVPSHNCHLVENLFEVGLVAKDERPKLQKNLKMHFQMLRKFSWYVAITEGGMVLVLTCTAFCTEQNTEQR